MRERPILFSAPMVRAILDGTKTQTRRVIKETPKGGVALLTKWAADPLCGRIEANHGAVSVEWAGGHAAPLLVCPYGAPGDRLWVRETWAVSDASEAEIEYAADMERRRFLSEGDAAWWKRWAAKSQKANGDPKCCPSIYMPRWASRITLAIESVRVERLQDISEEDARSEGVVALDGAGQPCSARHAFSILWASINGPESWDANPHVWVVSFKRSQP